MRRGQGEGSVFFRKDRKRWIAQVTLPDGRVRTRTARTRPDAREALRDLHLEIEKGEALQKGDPRLSLGDYLEHWLETKQSDWSSYRTRSAAQNNIRRVTAVLGGLKLEKLGEVHFRELLTELQKQYSPQTVHITWHMTKRALNDAVEDGLIPKNPMGRRLKPPAYDPPEVEILTDEQVRALLRTTEGSRWHAMWSLMVGVGLRGGECRGLQWSDIDRERGILFVRRQGSYEGKEKGMALTKPKSKSSRRGVFLPQFCLRALDAHRSLQDADRQRAGVQWVENDLIFTTKYGGIVHATQPYTRLKVALERAGLPPVRPHALRHTSATIRSDGGIDRGVIASLLGHASTRPTEGYIHVSEDLHRRATELLDELFGESDD